MATIPSIHSLKIASIEGQLIDFAAFKGKKIMVVNVASECGYTPQYKQLQELYEQFQDKLVIVGVPSNDFGAQEPGNNDDIRRFCQLRYGVTFPLTQKITVIGTGQHPLYAWLTSRAMNGLEDSSVTWNFQKYVLDENGALTGHFDPSLDPMDERIMAHLGLNP